MAEPHGRIPSLDGLRGISILFVLVAHLAGTRGFPLSTSTGNYLGLGHLGVNVFFVISGFLITGLLLAELDRNRSIKLGRFYFRRTLRIFPPYYVFLTAITAAYLVGVVDLRPRDLLHTLTYTSNYHDARSWAVGHTWSLSVEEQFYLLWPAVLLLTGSRRGMLVAALVVLLSPLDRLGEWEFARAASDGIGSRFETVADAIAVGCVLACVRPYLHQQAWYARAQRSAWFVAVPAVVMLSNLTHEHPTVWFAAGLTVVNISVALCLDWCVTFPAGRVGRVLNAAPLVFLGWISYSVYLWQQPFLNRNAATAWTAFPLNILLALSCALASYYLVERPSLKLRRYLEDRREPSRAAAPVGADPRPQALLPTS